MYIFGSVLNAFSLFSLLSAKESAIYLFVWAIHLYKSTKKLFKLSFYLKNMTIKHERISLKGGEKDEESKTDFTI